MSCRQTRTACQLRIHKVELRITITLICVTQLLGSCGTLPDGRVWGQDVTIKPGWEKVRNSAVLAAKSPFTWASLAGAAVLQIDGWDRSVSNWASDNTPVFGSQQSAVDASDVFKSVATASWVFTTLATPSGKAPGQWLAAKSKGFTVLAAARWLNTGITNALKDWADRDRPNGSNTQSFPAGHSSSATLTATLAARNLHYIEMGNNYRKPMEIGLGAIAAGTAWARVEGKVHYPSDVLVGTALGHFIGVFVNNAFMGLSESDKGHVDIAATLDSISIQFRREF